MRSLLRAIEHQLKFIAGAAGVAVVLAAAVPLPASAATVQSLEPTWLLLPGSLSATGGTWGLPATSATCGAENELSCEPAGDFIFSSSISSIAGPSYYTMTDDDCGTPGCVSDIITIANTGAGGVGEIKFYSDPNLSLVLTGLIPLGVLCDEGTTGCSATFGLTLGDTSTVSVSVASDSEVVFDPFGYGFDTSDQIKFVGVTPTGIPEPTILALLGLGLAGLGLVRRRRQAN